MLPRSIQLITLKHLLCARALGWGRGDTTGFSRQGRTQEDGPSPQLQRKLLGACPVSKARDSDASRLAADAQVPIVRPLASWVLSHQASAVRGRRSAHVLRGPSPADVPRGRSCVAASTKDLGTWGGGGLDGVTNSSRQVSCSISQTPDSAPPGGCRRPHPPSRARSLRRRRWRRSGLRCGAPAWETGRSVI